jgi:hypothetical protein
MTTLGDYEQSVRAALKDYPKFRIDKLSGDGVTKDGIDLGKDLGIQTNTDSVSIGGAAKVRGVDYNFGPIFGVTDYGAGQISFATAPPAGTNNVAINYRECVYRSEMIWEAVNAGRRALYPKFYGKDTATITVRNNVRTYDLTSADVNEPAMRTIFAGKNFKILRGMVQPNGASIDQFWIPFRRFWQEKKTTVQMWRMLGLNDTFKIECIHDFAPLFDPTQTTDIPDKCYDLVVLWALSSLALKQEPIRARIDSAAVLQSSYANPPGTMAQTSEDFRTKFWDLYKALDSEPPTFEVRDMPLGWESV